MKPPHPALAHTGAGWGTTKKESRTMNPNRAKHRREVPKHVAYPPNAPEPTLAWCNGTNLSPCALHRPVEYAKIAKHRRVTVAEFLSQHPTARLPGGL
jgi:hypothetical protein